MNFSRRNLFTLAGSAAALAGLAACGSNTGGITSGASNAPSTSASGAASGSKPTLTQWYHEYGEKGVQEAVTQYAAEYPNATVTVKWNPGDYAKLLNAQLLTTDVPDVFESEQGATLDMIKAGQVVDLTDLMDPVKDQFNPGVIERFTFEDKIWSIPQTIDMQLLYYRPSLLDKAGVKPPTTFDELVTAANALATKDRGGFFAGNDGGVGVLGTMFIWASGHEQLNADRTELAFLDDKFYAAIKQYADFYKSGKGLLKAASKDWFDGSPFVNEETAMQWGGLWSLPDITKAFGEDVGVAMFPSMGPDGQQAVPFGAFGACVAAKGKNVDVAKDFVKWLWIDQEDKQVDFSDSYGTHIPAKPALADKTTKLKSGPGADAATFVAKSGFTNDIMWTGPLGQAFSAAVNNSIVKGTDPKTEFAAVQKTADAELARQQ